MSMSISLHMGQDWTFSLQGLQVTWPFLHCMMGGSEIRAHTCSTVRYSSVFITAYESGSPFVSLQSVTTHHPPTHNPTHPTQKPTGHSRFILRSSGSTSVGWGGLAAVPGPAELSRKMTRSCAGDPDNSTPPTCMESLGKRSSSVVCPFRHFLQTTWWAAWGSTRSCSTLCPTSPYWGAKLEPGARYLVMLLWINYSWHTLHWR